MWDAAGWGMARVSVAFFRLSTALRLFTWSVGGLSTPLRKVTSSTWKDIWLSGVIIFWLHLFFFRPEMKRTFYLSSEPSTSFLGGSYLSDPRGLFALFLLASRTVFVDVSSGVVCISRPGYNSFIFLACLSFSSAFSGKRGPLPACILFLIDPGRAPIECQWFSCSCLQERV